MATTIKEFSYKGVKCEIIQWLDAYEVKTNGKHVANLLIDNWNADSVEKWVKGQIDSVVEA